MSWCRHRNTAHTSSTPEDGIWLPKRQGNSKRSHSLPRKKKKKNGALKNKCTTSIKKEKRRKRTQRSTIQLQRWKYDFRALGTMLNRTVANRCALKRVRPKIRLAGTGKCVEPNRLAGTGKCVEPNRLAGTGKCVEPNRLAGTGEMC